MPRSLFLRLAIRADDDTGLAQLLHAADHVTRAGRAPLPERDADAGGSLAPRYRSQLRATAVVVHPAQGGLSETKNTQSFSEEFF